VVWRGDGCGSGRSVGETAVSASSTERSLRFVVTNLPATEFDAPTTYKDKSCARDEVENRHKEQPLCRFTDRTSCATMRANQLRLWFSTLA